MLSPSSIKVGCPLHDAQQFFDRSHSMSNRAVTDRDGRIATKDLGKVVHSLGQDPAGINFKEVIQGLDLKDKKTIDLLEFLAVMTILRPDLLNQEQLEGFIQSLDMDEKCSVGAKELKKVMSDLGRRSSKSFVGIHSQRLQIRSCLKLISIP